MAGRKLTVLPALGEFPAADDLMYVVDVSDTSESPQGTSKAVEFSDIMQAGAFTLTPTVVSGDGTSTDVLISFLRVGNRVHGIFQIQEVVISDGDAAIDLDFDFTGTTIEPSANFVGGFAAIGSIATTIFNDGVGGNIVQECSYRSVNGTKKIQLSLVLESALSGTDFTSKLSGNFAFMI